MVSFIDACEMQISPTPKLVPFEESFDGTQRREPTLRGDDASCARDWFHALQKFREETDRLSISMRWTAWTQFGIQDFP